MFKMLIVMATLLSVPAQAKVEEVELSSCFQVKPPQRLVPVSIYLCYGNAGYRDLSVNYSYTRVMEVLIIVTSDFGQVLSERVYQKRVPTTEVFGSPSDACIPADRFSNEAFSHFQNRYQDLLANACE